LGHNFTPFKQHRSTFAQEQPAPLSTDILARLLSQEKLSNFIDKSPLAATSHSPGKFSITNGKQMKNKHFYSTILAWQDKCSVKEAIIFPHGS